MKVSQNFFTLDWEKTKAAILRNVGNICYLHPIEELDIVQETDLLGLQTEITRLDSNTFAFLTGKPACNALLWGARGCGKSSVVKAVLSKYLAESPLRILEIEGKDIAMFPIIMDFLRPYKQYSFIIFCDDLAFSLNDYSYRSLKSSLEGSFEKKPCNILIYATSNLRRIIQEDTSQNQEYTHEILSLSDRFPLSIGFYTFGTTEYLTVLEFIILKSFQETNKRGAKAKAKKLFETIQQDAINFATQAGNKSPRTAHEFWNLYKNQKKSNHC
ncbi:DUF815 domain-containing protein [Helicobacter aurati]|uniref:DUF815 domain-containing protein n=1 Tax=Helicobacter aurati TaxID=137778 RepID=A0A3D8J7H4_9HELI|nr:DUF815 domain-containing protein [Helicobacter aurati]RDU73145.1 DUF815 domain-containing protein [Helicobacter aurati]